VLAAAVAGCSATKDAPKYELSDGRYSYRQPGEKFQKIYAFVDGDSVSLFSDEKGTKPVVPQILRDEIFLKRSFDVDVVAVPFKFRPASVNLPRQLTTDFNGKHRGLSIGAFGGLGTAAITPWTTNYMMNDEYTGFVLSRGIAAMAGISNLTVGIGVGWDNLTDRDRTIWIYQHKAWYGVTIGLNLN
jgi:hypothetical protein